MRAVLQDAYGTPGEVLRLREVDRPVAGDDEVLVRVRAASVHPDVWHVVTGWPRVLRLMGAGLRRPKNPVPGTDMAGVVESVGRRVTRFQPGDEVFGETHRGFQWVNGGAFAEFVAAPESALALKPAGVSFEQAAAVPSSGFIALHNLRSGGRIAPGHRVLVNGAGGGVGTIVVQLARADGARVTAVDEGSKLEMLRSLGADHVIDYTREDVLPPGAVYDLIVDVASTLPYAACKAALSAAGKFVLIGHDHYGTVGRRTLGSLPRFLGLVPRSLFDRHLVSLGATIPSKRDVMEALRSALEAGTLTPIVDRTFPLGEVPEALHYLPRARGKVLITP